MDGTAHIRFERALDAWAWLRDERFAEGMHGRNPDWRHDDGRRAEIHRDIDQTGRDDSPTAVVITRPDPNKAGATVPRRRVDTRVTVAHDRFERALDAWAWLEEEGFEEGFHGRNPDWRHPDGRVAEVHRDIDHTGRDDSPTAVVVTKAT